MDWKKLLSDDRIRKSFQKDVRNPIESDYGRIIYSPALRRMHDKTQVFPLTTDDNIHSRLTHSNEVMSLGYTFGLKLSTSKLIQRRTKKTEAELIRLLPVLLQNVCLIHDIGNPPFGHFAETIISEYFQHLSNESEEFKTLNEHQQKDFLHFDGNAQGLRVVTKLQYLNDVFGLNLTFATLGAYLKYPNYEERNKDLEKKANDSGNAFNEELIERKKHGVFYSEKDFFDRIVEGCGLKHKDRVLRHPLCYLMEAADSIAYLCMDMEDGFNKGLFDISYIKKCFSENKSDIAKKIVSKCNNTLDNDNTKIVNIRIEIIGYLVDLAYNNFERNLTLIEKGLYNEELIQESNNEIFEELNAFSCDKIFTSREINYLESTGHSVITGLLDFYIKFSFNKNKGFVRKVETLISKSIIQCAIEENLIELGKQKLANELNQIKDKLDKFKDENLYTKDLHSKKAKLELDLRRLKALSKRYIALFDKQMSVQLTFKEKAKLSQVKVEIKKMIKPQYGDLDNYSKFRVILDFISGMTDQYALNHYQKISGQKIN